MGRQKQKKAQEPESEEEEEVEDEELDEKEFGEFEDEVDDYVSKEQIKEELKKKISEVKGDQKVAFAALFELYGKQEEIDDEETKEIEAIKHKYRLKTEELLNKTRKIVTGESTENGILQSSTLLNAVEKTKPLKEVSLPDFWPTVVKNSSFEVFIDKTELPAIDSIKNIIVNFTPSVRQINIEIQFNDNSVFTDSVLKATLIEESEGKIKHTYDQPKYKPHFAKVKDGFFSVFSEVSDEQTDGLFEYWLNFYQEELPHALAFYFELREGTFHSQTPQFVDEDYDDVDEDEENPAGKGKNKKKGIEKPQCNQQ